MALPEDSIREYLERMAQIRGTGGATSETSYYSALENFLNQIGSTITPGVIVNGQLRNQGAGHPDFGMYSKGQTSKGELKQGQGEIPKHGIIEVKPLGNQTWQTATGVQATKYFDRYKLVLITNYRDFRLLGEDAQGNAIEREFYSIAKDEASFWALASDAGKSAKEHVGHLDEFLRRVMMNAAPLTKPQDIAWYLASYARDALTTLETRDASALLPLRDALETALGISFEGEKGEHFFRSTLVQTLFYGIFSAWVVHARSASGSSFDWRHAGYILTVPMIRTLFEEIAKPTRLAPLNIMPALDRTGEALNRVDKAAFFASFDKGNAVQHFYEPFLEYFDPDLRKQMGVWYTPPEIVEYMVERVDSALRTELGIEDGLANKNVYVLDPCCGTGAFVVEVLRRIEKTLRAKGDDPLIGEDVKEAARERVFGFEIMSAPFVIAHWQIGELLASTGVNAPLDANKGERPSVYLTNSLTGWTPATGPKAALPLFPELEVERDQAAEVKQVVPLLVVIGNPPYNAFAGTSPKEEQGLVDAYKDGLIDTWGIKKFNLDELYVRFLRIAERRIAETGSGLFCYISNYSYLTDPSFVVARQKLLAEFDDIWIDCLNGDSRETGKLTPEGKPDPSVFSTTYNRAGIQVGTSVGLFIRKEQRQEVPRVWYRDVWGVGKRKELLNSLEVTPFADQYQPANPQVWNKLSFRPGDVGVDYLAWPKIVDLAAEAPINGLMEKRGGALIDIEHKSLSDRMKQYLDPEVSWNTLKLLGAPLAAPAARFEPQAARARLLAAEQFQDKRIVRYLVRPFDVRYAYYTSIRPIWNEPRPQLWTQYSGGNEFLVTRPAGVARPEGAPIMYTTILGDNDAQRGHSYYFPTYIHQPDHGLLAGFTAANLSLPARAYLDLLGYPDPDTDSSSAKVLWHHSLAIGYSPQYAVDQAYGLEIDWPRIPLPDSRNSLDRSAGLGRTLAALVDPDTPAPGVNAGVIADAVKMLGVVSSANIRVTAGWGRMDSLGKVFPGRGKWTTRDWTTAEGVALSTFFASFGITSERGYQVLGRAVEIYLNDDTFWKAVPEAVWNFHIGGYQVLKKWLSYREESLLGRPLIKEEAREFTTMVRRLSVIVLMRDSLDANYISVRDASISLTNAETNFNLGIQHSQTDPSLNQ